MRWTTIQEKWNRDSRQICNVVQVSYIGIAILLPFVLSDKPDHGLYSVGVWLGGFIPSINSMSGGTTFPAAARKTLALLWVLSPAVCACLALAPDFIRPNVSELKRRPWMFVMGVLVFLSLPLIAAFIPVGQAKVGDAKFLLILTSAIHDSRFWFGAIAGGFVAGAAVGMALAIQAIKLTRQVL